MKAPKVETFKSGVTVPVSLVEKDDEYLWDAIDRVVGDARRMLINAELVGGLAIAVTRNSTFIRPTYRVTLLCQVVRR